ncbi:hypothetical protein QBC42DRAFT_66398 [Cladorrhinum samala]|uniref:Secreted protein n=1 Tax=Cladorrhinum samala TaxID=585594 RepID=A0AAV9HTT6_9PEZI|nr:hypothetical protein QBC42DRAFT_66398 [Cladorrhinum samala]
MLLSDGMMVFLFLFLGWCSGVSPAVEGVSATDLTLCHRFRKSASSVRQREIMVGGKRTKRKRCNLSQWHTEL